MPINTSESGKFKSNEGPTKRKATQLIVEAIIILTRFSIHLGMNYINSAHGI